MFHRPKPNYFDYNKATDEIIKLFKIKNLSIRTKFGGIYDCYDKKKKIYELKLTSDFDSFNRYAKNPIYPLSMHQRANIEHLDYLLAGYYHKTKGYLIKYFLFSFKENKIIEKSHIDIPEVELERYNKMLIVCPKILVALVERNKQKIESNLSLLN